MDSEDDMHDANDIKSLDDDYYRSETEDVAMDNHNDYAVDDYFAAFPRTDQSFTILKESDIRQQQKDDISRVSAVLSIPQAAATILLCHYNWSIVRVNDAWFADEGKVRRPSGVLLLVVNMLLILTVEPEKIMMYLVFVHIDFVGIAPKRLTVRWIVTPCQSGL
jgi:hypothetical protein